MKTWFFFMTLLLAPFWAFGKEKSTDQAETDTETNKGVWEVPEFQFPRCYFFMDEVGSIFWIATEGSCENVISISSEGSTVLPLDQKSDDEFINHLDQLGILNRLGAEGGHLCGTRH